MRLVRSRLDAGMGITETSVALRLHALGGLSISSNGTTLSGSVARRRSLALLALLSSSREGRISDERVLVLLWPDLDLQRARNNLKQVAFTLRQALGRDAFLRTATSLHLDREVFSVDRWDFEEAIANGDAARAVAIYGGGFLAGFHTSGLPDFERWVEGERETLCRLYASAVSTLALGAEAVEDYPGAIEWWRKAVAADRLNDSTAQRLVRALALSGDTVGALQQARVHEQLIRQELETRPSPSFQQLVEGIRDGTPLAEDASKVRILTPPSVRAILQGPVTRAAPETPPAIGAHVGAEAVTEGQGTGRRNGSTDPELHRTAKPAARTRRAWTAGERRIAAFTTRFTSAAATLVLIGTLAILAVTRFGRSAAADTGDDAPDAVIMPFTVIGGDEADAFGAIVSELLASSLDGSLGLRAQAVGGTDSLHAPSSLARRAAAKRLASHLRARYYVSGDIFQSGARLRIAAEFRSRSDESLLDRAQVDGDQTEIFDLVDQLASQLLAGRIAGGRKDVVRVASVSTSSLPAAKAYYRGEEALAEGGFRKAIDAYEESIRLDPTFALAHYGLAVAADMLGDEEQVVEAAKRALEHSHHLPSRQRRLLSAFLARHQGDVSGARRQYAQLTVDYPADVEAWRGLGETIFHLNPLEGRPATDAAAAFERAAQLDSLDAGAWLHLARIAALENDEPRSRRLIARARGLAPDQAVARYALHVLSLGIPLDDAGTALRGARRVSATDAVNLLANFHAENLRRFARLLTGESRDYGLRLQSLVEVGEGRIMNALALLDSCSSRNHGLSIEARSRMAALPFVPVDAGELDEIRRDLTAWSGNAHPAEMAIDSATHAGAHPYLKLHRLGLIALRLNDAATAELVAGQLDAATRSLPDNAPGRLLSSSLEGHLAAAQGRTSQALRLLEQASAGRVASATSLEAYDRLLRARLLEQSGRYDDALGFYAQLGLRSPFEVVLVWQAELGTARIREKRGNTVMAAHYYNRVAERLKASDPGLHREREAARQKVMDLLPAGTAPR